MSRMTIDGLLEALLRHDQIPSMDDVSRPPGFEPARPTNQARRDGTTSSIATLQQGFVVVVSLAPDHDAENSTSAD